MRIDNSSMSQKPSPDSSHPNPACVSAPDGLRTFLPIEGPSYTRLARWLLTGWCTLLISAAVWAFSSGDLEALADAPREVRWLLGGALLVVALQAAAVFRSRTRIDSEGITQTGLWTKQMRWEDIRSARFLGLPWANRWLPPRLALRSGHGRYLLIQGGTPALHRAFAHIAIHVQTQPLRRS